jgi:DNA-binding Lrp family transcriptional regulator
VIGLEESKGLTTLEEIKAINDPYRLQIIFYYQRMGRAATVKEIADNMGEVPAKVHYHVKKLESAGILRLSYTKNINGIIAKYYELTARDFHIKVDNIKVDNMSPDVSKQVAEQNFRLTVIAAYDSSKKIAVEDAAEDSKPMFNINTLYMTDERVKEFRTTIYEYIKKYKIDTHEEDAKEVHFFNVMVPVKSIKK